MNREKVIKALEICVGENDFSACINEKCPYIGGSKDGYCITNLERDALSLLKEQDETIKELQNAYGYLQNQFFDAQDKLLKEQEAKPPVHIHEEYPIHDWECDENGDINEFAFDGDFHNGPVCKRCYYSFCILCDPDGWNKKPCIIDEYKCPKCGRHISKGTKFCSDCGQAVKWK